MRIKWILLVALYASCQSHGRWQYQNIPAKKIEHCNRALYSTRNPSRGINLECIQAGTQLTTYLQVQSGFIPPSAEDEKKVRVTLITEGKRTTFFADFHLGNERVRLSSLQQSHLFSLLEEGKEVTLELEGYQETIDPTHFSTVYKKLTKPPYRLPFHLPI